MLDDIKEAMTRCRANESTIVGILNRSNHGEPLPGDILEVVGAKNVDNAEALAPVLREAVARLREDYATVTEEVSTYARIFIGGGENPKKVIVAYKSAEADAVARVEFHSWLVASIADACTRFSKLQSSTAADTEDSKRETSSLAEGVRIYRWVYTNLFPDDISEQLERWGDCGSASLTGAKRPDATPPAASERTSKSPDAATSQCGTTPVYADSTTTSTELNPSVKEVRGSNGRFVAGNPGGPGRPRRNAQERYYAAVLARVSADDLGAVLASLVDEAKKGDTKAAGLLVRHFLPRGRDLMFALTMAEHKAEKMAGTIGWDEPERDSPSGARIVQMPPPPKEEPGDSAFQPTG